MMGENGLQRHSRTETQGLLHEDIKAFAIGTNSEGKKLTCVERSQHAIILLRSLPCARAAVLEQICEVFHEAVHKYVLELERQKISADHSSLSYQQNSQLDDVLHSVHEILMNFVSTNTRPWAPLILKWSVNLLGQLSSKYAYKGVLSSMTLAERLQMWLSCPATQMLMEICTQCFARLINTNPDLCVDYLLECAVQYAPHFDWVVAHLGSFFHHAIIACLLTCARKEFNSVNVDRSLMVSTVVRVLNHLAVQHSTEVKTAILAQFKESLSSSCGVIEVLKFLLHLASLSPELVNITVMDVIQTLTAGVLLKLHQTLVKSENYDPSLLAELVNLVIRTSSGSYQILMFLINTSTQLGQDTKHSEESAALDKIQRICADILDHILCQLQDWTMKRLEICTGDTDFIENPFLTHLQQHVMQLCASMMLAKDERLKWLRKVTFLVGANGGQENAVEILYYILLNTPTERAVILFVELLDQLEYFHSDILSATVHHLISQVKSLACTLKPARICVVFENLLSLLKVKQNNCKQNNLIIGSLLRSILQSHYEAFLGLLHHSDSTVVLSVLKLLQEIGSIGPGASLSCYFQVCQTISSAFFRALHQCEAEKTLNNDIYKSQVLHCKAIFIHLSEEKQCQKLIIRQLVEGALHEDNTIIFGGHPQESSADREDIFEEASVSLLDQNRNPQNSSRLPLTSTSIFYAGVFGKGVKKNTKEKEIVEDVSVATRVLVQTLTAVCQASQSSDAVAGKVKSDPDLGEVMETDDTKCSLPDTMSSAVLVESADYIAALLLDWACPDILPVVGVWSEEELHRITVERDLKMKKTFEGRPLLWILLEFVAEVRPALCNCAVIVQSLLAQTMLFWEASRLSKASHSKKQLKTTQRILRVIAQAGWLPKPLCYVGDIFHALTPKEVFSLVSSVWRFLKENPPRPELFSIRGTDGQLERTWPGGCVDILTDLLHDIFFTNIADLGHCFARFFPIVSQ